MRKEFSADERNKKESGAENQESGDDRDHRVIEAPFQAAGVLIADPIEDAVLLFLDATLEPVRRQHRNDRERENERAEERKSHGVRHGME